MLSGFQELSIPEQRVVDDVVFPLCLSSPSSTASMTTKESTIDALQSQHERLSELLRVHKSILFRNCGLFTAQDFHDFIIATGLQGMEYIGGAAVRTQITERVFTANESPSSEKIPFHHEMAQTPNPPTHLFFFCEIAPTIDGETPLLASTEVCELLSVKHPEFMSAIERYGVRYIRYMPEFDDHTSAIGRGWRSTFQTDSVEGAENALRKLGSSWEWQADGVLKTITAPMPAIRVDEGPNRLGKKAFYNSIVAAFTGWNDSRNRGEEAVILADEQGTKLNPDVIADCCAVMNDVCVSIAWNEGDVMLVDNRTVMHSRRPFEGPRRILAGLVRDPLR